MNQGLIHVKNYDPFGFFIFLFQPHFEIHKHIYCGMKLNEVSNMSGFSEFFIEETLLTEIKRYSKGYFEKILKKEPRKDKGVLIVFEGIDGAGKSTQVQLLKDWLKDQDYDILFTQWNSSEVVAPAIKDAKNNRELTPKLYCLLHAADLIHRYEQEILPALEDNKIVICDRYVYTSLVRDQARGIRIDLINEIYSGLREPDILFHCVLPIHIAFTRLIKEKGLSYYGTGSDMNLADSREENYIKYENILNRIYNEILPKVKSYCKLNTNRPKKVIAKDVQHILSDKFGIGKYK